MSRICPAQTALNRRLSVDASERPRSPGVEREAAIRKARQEKIVQRTMNIAAAALVGTTGFDTGTALGIPHQLLTPNAANPVAIRIAHLSGAIDEHETLRLAPLAETRKMCRVAPTAPISAAALPSDIGRGET